MQAFRIFRHALAACAVALPLVALSTQPAQAAVFVSVTVAPPMLPVYTQPLCPGPDYIWTPGYWAYGDEGYFWVPGVWVEAPEPGYLWTPAWWGWENGAYIFHAGYWGPHVGFYGGVNYGFGYTGDGFVGGEWRGRTFFYNRAVANVDVVHATNIYVRPITVVNHTTVAFNGGPGGIAVRPRPEQTAFSREQHLQPTALQLNHAHFAAQDRTQWASVNHGRPGVPAAASFAAYRPNFGNPTGAARPAISAREANQDQRIANGLRSGQMTSGEAARANGRQSAIDQQVHTDRANSGGALSPQQRNQINREQNNAGQQIYRSNHNDAMNQQQHQQTNREQNANNRQVNHEERNDKKR